jgi:hypothetical protein
MFSFLFVISSVASLAANLQPVGEFLSALPANEKRCFAWKADDTAPIKTLTAEVFRDDSTPGYPTFGIELKTQLKAQKKTFSTYFLCDEKSADCTVECDGGEILARASRNSLEIETEGFVLSGSCDGSNTVKFPGQKNRKLVFDLPVNCQ